MINLKMGLNLSPEKKSLEMERLPPEKRGQEISFELEPWRV